MPSRYDIVLLPFPFTDGPAAEPRPALVITTSERHGDVLLTFISFNVSSPVAPGELEAAAQ
jgi:mRNA-degrading endonuclease toxin of MazEF toxin-antitoxin module